MAYVRAASASDAPALAALQQRVWHDTYGHLPAIAAALASGIDPEAWQAVLDESTTHVLVAVGSAHDTIVGYCLFTTTGTESEIHTLEIDPTERRHGHGSRLLTAFADASAPAHTAVMWIPIAAEPVRAFLTSAGWGPDGSVRDLAADDDTVLREVRMVTDLGPYRQQT